MPLLIVDPLLFCCLHGFVELNRIDVRQRQKVKYASAWNQSAQWQVATDWIGRLSLKMWLLTICSKEGIETPHAFMVHINSIKQTVQLNTHTADVCFVSFIIPCTSVKCTSSAMSEGPIALLIVFNCMSMCVYIDFLQWAVIISALLLIVAYLLTP